MIGVLSDAHGNFLAFQKALAVLQKLGAQQIIFLGDAVGYVPSPAVVEYLMQHPEIQIIKGNHEAYLLSDDIDENKDQVYQLKFTRELLSDEQKAFIANWPSFLRKETSCGSLLFVHGSPDNHTFDYVYPDSELSEFNPEADFVFMGNSHHPFIRKQDHITYINAGSCGLPRDDGRYGAVALFNEETGNCKIVRFDITRETKQTLQSCPEVHESVAKLFTRKKDELLGELHE